MPDAAARRAIVATVLTSSVLTGVYLLAPPMGTDLSAQAARADFFADHGWTPVDLSWYGGVEPYGYSIVSPPVMALLGPRPAGALAAVLAALALVWLLLRTRARRPALGGMLGAFCFFGNLVSGRVTFALGVACGLFALVALTGPRRPLRLVLAGAGAILAGLTSPVAGLFVGLAGVALAGSALLPAPRPVGRRRAGRAPAALTAPMPAQAVLAGGVTLAVGAGIPVFGLALGFGSGGWMNISGLDTLRATVTGLAVALLVPHRAVRIGALLSSTGVLAAFLLPTPVGLNATRLAIMFALPVVAAYAVWPAWIPRPLGAAGLAAVLLALVVWQPPVSVPDLRDAGNPTASRAYFQPLVERLAAEPVLGRVEVVPTRNYWEAAYVAGHTPLARGWLRQADFAHHPLFFDGTLTADTYRAWLGDNGVTHVALANAELSWVGSREAELIRGDLPYLSEMWRDKNWTLYRVTDRPSIVDGGVLLAATPARMVFDVDRPATVTVRVRWSPWLTLDGPPGTCLEPDGDWITVWAPAYGRYTLGSALTGGPHCAK